MQPATPASPEPEDTDVLVVGGGPAGSTAATLLARRGWRVVLLERDRHPRFHIGESLLPMNLPILERLGVLDQVRAVGVLKPGADFPLQPAADGSVGYSAFRFDRMLRPVVDHAYHVARADFDTILIGQARASGVDAREQVRVRSVAWDAGQRAIADADGPTGPLRIRARYLVDASGRDTLLGNALGLKKRNARHQSAAIFSHFKGVALRPGADAGNITVQRFEHGWIWLIPLADDVMSIGVVGSPAFMRERRGDSEGLLMRTLMAQPEVAARMAGSERVAPVHATGNYGYSCKRMAGRGWVMVGDAYAFVDPIFSSGVLLAMSSAEAAADVVDGALRTPARERALQRAMKRRHQRGLREFTWFIYRFNSPVMRYLFANPRNVLRVEEAVVSMLAGDVFDAPQVRWRLRVFRLIYAITALSMAPATLAARWRRRRGSTAAFSGDTLQQDAT